MKAALEEILKLDLNLMSQVSDPKKSLRMKDPKLCITLPSVLIVVSRAVAGWGE